MAMHPKRQFVAAHAFAVILDDDAVLARLLQLNVDDAVALRRRARSPPVP